MGIAINLKKTALLAEVVRGIGIIISILYLAYEEFREYSLADHQLAADYTLPGGRLLPHYRAENG